MADRVKGITVEIGGDTTGLSKALSGVNKEISNTQKKLKDVERLLKLDPGNTELLRQKYDLLNKSIDSTEEKLDALKTAEKQVQAQFQRGEIGEEQYNALKREIIATETSLRDLKSEAKQTDNSIKKIDGTPFEKLKASIKDTTKSLEDAGKEASNFGDYLKAGTIVEGSKSIIDSLKGMAEETKEYRKIMASLDISSERAGYSAEQTAESYETLYGVLGDDQTAATTTANLQAIGLEQGKLTELINGTIGAWATYGDSIPIDGLAESINETIKAGQVTGTFADVLNWASLEGETFGVKLKANTKANEEWNKAVQDASTAEDYFNLALQDAADSTERANLVMQLFSSQGLTDAGEAWQENNQALVDNNQANADFQQSMAELSETVMPIVTDITEATTKIVNFILDNKEGVVTALVAIGGALAVFKIVGIIQSLISGFQTFFGVIKTGQGVMAAFNAVMNANLIMLIISAVGALVSAFIYLWNTSEGFRNFWIGLWESIKEFFISAWNAIVGFFTETIPNAWNQVVDLFNRAVEWWNNLWQGIGDFFSDIWNGICSFFTETIPNAWNWLKSQFDKIGQWWSNLWQGISDTFAGIWNGLVDIAKAPINGIIGLINGAIRGINWIIDGINSLSFDLPDWLGGAHIGFNIGKIGEIPYLAKGGILSKGSAVVGEAGPELLTMLGNRAMVQPLTNNNTSTTNLGGVNINIYSSPGQDTHELADIIMERMQTVYQMKGAVWAR